MFGEILTLSAWLIAGGIAWWFRGTLGKEIKKKDATLYDNIKNDPENTLKVAIEEAEKKKKEEETILDRTQQGIDSTAENRIKEGTSEYSAALQTIQQAKKKIAEHEAEIKQLNTIKEKGLDAFDWGWKNIAWTGGIFLVVGLLLHWMMKKIMEMFNNKK